MFPSLWVVQSLCHQVRNLLFGVYVQHADARMSTNLKEPLHVDPVGPGQVSQGHWTGLLNDMYHGLAVLSDDENRGALAFLV